MNILNATIKDSFIDGASNANFETGEGLNQVDQETWVVNAYTNVPVIQTLGTAVGFVLKIVPDEGYCVAAEAYKLVESNSDMDAIDYVELTDHVEPWSESNYVVVTVYLKSTFIVPYGVSNKVIQLDIEDDPGARLFGVRYVTVSIVNDFAETIMANPNGTPYASQIPSMTSDPIKTQQWNDCFKYKKPLKFSDSVTFTPGVDVLGNDIVYHDSRSIHLGGDVTKSSSEVIGLASYHVANAVDTNVFHDNSRKDVIHVGFNCVVGEPIKLGTITLKLNQDIYHAINSDGGNLGSTDITAEQWLAGYVENYGRVYGWGDKMSADLTNSKAMLSRGYKNSWWSLGSQPSIEDLNAYRVDAPTGLISTGRYRGGSNDYIHIPELPTLSVPSVDTLMITQTSGTQFLGLGTGAPEGSILNMAEQESYYYYDYDEFIGGFSGVVFSSSSEPSNLSTMIGEIDNTNNVTYLPEGSGFDNVVVSTMNRNAISLNSLNNWAAQLYDHLDLHPFAWFPTFGDKGNLWSGPVPYTQVGDTKILRTTPFNNNGLGGDENGFWIQGVTKEKWAPQDWVKKALQSGSDLGQTGDLQIEEPLDLMTQIWEDIGLPLDLNDPLQTHPNTWIAYSATTTALENYYRTISFEVWYQDDGTYQPSGNGMDPMFSEEGEPNFVITQGNFGACHINNPTAFGISCRTKWDMIPWRQAVNLGAYLTSYAWQHTAYGSPLQVDLEAFGGVGYSFGYINQGISSNDWTDFPWAGQRSLRNFSRDFTGVSVKSDSIKDRLEIREVNLFTGEPNRNVNQNIIPTGGINSQSDSYIEIVGDKGASFRMTMQEVEDVEVEASGNIRSTASDSPSNTILNGGWLDIIPENETITIGDSGKVRFSLPNIPGIDRASGWKKFEVCIQPNNNGTQYSTVINSTAKNTDDYMTGYNSTNAVLKKYMYQYPRVHIQVSATKDDDWQYTQGYNVNQILKFGYDSNKSTGIAYRDTSDISFIAESDKSVRFEIRVKETGKTFTINESLVDQVAELNNISFNNNASTITHDGSVRVFPGMRISGNGIPADTIVESVTNSESFTISNNTTGGARSHQTLSLGVLALNAEDFIEPVVDNNGDIVVFSSLIVKTGEGTSTADPSFATLTGRIRYDRFGRQSQTYNIDLTKILTNS